MTPRKNSNTRNHSYCCIYISETDENQINIACPPIAIWFAPALAGPVFFFDDGLQNVHNENKNNKQVSMNVVKRWGRFQHMKMTGH